jgi:SAM-dependent methyltransferase
VTGARKWDAKLYEGSAPYYACGRVPYPPELAETLRAELRLDGTGRLLDVGCGPGSLALLLAPFFAEVVGLDPDPRMIAEVDREACVSAASA